MSYSKYNAKKITLDGITFASQAEGTRWLELKLWERAGGISELSRQIPYALIVPDINGKPFKVETYVADFVYYERMGGVVPRFQLVVEDCKGFRTADYKRKKKWMAAVLGIEIRESGTSKPLTKKRRKP